MAIPTPFPVGNQRFVNVSTIWAALSDVAGSAYSPWTQNDVAVLQSEFYDAGDWDFSWGDNSRSMIGVDVFCKALRYCAVVVFGTRDVGESIIARIEDTMAASGEDVLIDLEN